MITSVKERVQEATQTVLSQTVFDEDNLTDIQPEHVIFMAQHPQWLSVSMKVSAFKSVPVGFAVPGGYRVAATQFMGRDADIHHGGLDIYLYYRNLKDEDHYYEIGRGGTDAMYELPGALRGISNITNLRRQMRRCGASDTNSTNMRASLTREMIETLCFSDRCATMSEIELITDTRSSYARPCDADVFTLHEGCVLDTQNCTHRQKERPCSADDCGIALLAMGQKRSLPSVYTEPTPVYETMKMTVLTPHIYSMLGNEALHCYKFRFPMGIPKEFIATCLITDAKTNTVYVPKCLLNTDRVTAITVGHGPSIRYDIDSEKAMVDEYRQKLNKN